jgi:cyclopropane-fatty-acyl-phospholipid synthase
MNGEPMGIPAPPADAEDRPDALAGLMTSDEALAAHYEISNEFYMLWLDRSIHGYSCGLWDPARIDDSLEAAQERKVDFYADALGIGSGRRVLDVGCGWGGTMRWYVEHHDVGHVVGLTRSPAQLAWMREHPIPHGVPRLENWASHQAPHRYDAISCIEAYEHFAREGLLRNEKIRVYRAFFRRCYDWLVDDGRLAMQANCFENTTERMTAPRQGPLTDFLRGQVLQDATLAHLSELVLGFEPYFELEYIKADSDHFRPTIQEWIIRLQTNRPRAEQLVGATVYRQYWAYMAAWDALMRIRDWSLYRIVLRRRRRLKL